MSTALNYFFSLFKNLFIYFLIFSFTLFCFTILYWFCHTLTWISHGCSDASWQFLSGCLPFPSWGLALRILWLQAKKKHFVNMEKGIYWREMGELSGLKENQESSLETVGIVFSGVLGSGNWWVSPYRAIGHSFKTFFFLFLYHFTRMSKAQGTDREASFSCVAGARRTDPFPK